MAMVPSATKTFADGEVIFEQGDSGDAMYVIEAGRVQIYRAKGSLELKLATLGAGEYFGEMSLLLEAPRSASARALGETTVSVIRQESFKQLSVSDPVIWRLMSEMGQRIQDVDSRLDDYIVRDAQRETSLGDFIASRQSFY